MAAVTYRNAGRLVLPDKLCKMEGILHGRLASHPLFEDQETSSSTITSISENLLNIFTAANIKPSSLREHQQLF